MSEENVKLVRDFAEAGQREDWKRIGELIAPDAEMLGTVGGLGEGQVYSGLSEMKGEYEGVDQEAWEERRLEPTGFRHIDDLVVMFLHEYRRGRGSGVELEVDTAVVFTIRDARIVRIQGYMDQNEALEAAGLQP
jgi:ketosteroid isomerase-like protein